MKYFIPLAAVFIASVMALSSCGKNPPAVEVGFLSYEADITGMSADEAGNADMCLDIRITTETYKEYWLSGEFSVISAESGNEVKKLDKFKFTDEKNLMQKEGSAGSVLKQFRMDWFDIKESGVYILRNNVYTGSAETVGVLDVLVKVTVPGDK